MHVSTNCIEGPPVRINCPACGARDVPCESWDQRETVNFIFRHTSTWVRCGACGAALLSHVRAAELAGQTPQQLEGLVVARVSLITNVMGVLAILLFWAPVVGQVLCLTSWLLNRGRRRGWARLSLVLLVVSLLLAAGVAALIAYDEYTRHSHGIR